MFPAPFHLPSSVRLAVSQIAAPYYPSNPFRNDGLQLPSSPPPPQPSWWVCKPKAQSLEQGCSKTVLLSGIFQHNWCCSCQECWPLYSSMQWKLLEQNYLSNRFLFLAVGRSILNKRGWFKHFPWCTLVLTGKIRHRYLNRPKEEQTVFCLYHKRNTFETNHLMFVPPHFILIGLLLSQ